MNKKILISGLIISLMIFQSTFAVEIRKSEYPKYVLDSNIFKYENEQRKAIDWIASDRGLEKPAYENFANGRWWEDSIQDGGFNGLSEAFKWNIANIWTAPINKDRFSINSTGDMIWNKNGIYGLYEGDIPGQILINYCANFQKGKWDGKYTQHPCLNIETLKYSNFNDYKKSDGTRDINFVMDYIKVRDTMIGLGINLNGGYLAKLGPDSEMNNKALSQVKASKWMFWSILKQKYYKKGYRDIDEELKFLIPGIFTDITDNLTYDGKDTYDKYSVENLSKYYMGTSWSLATFIKYYPNKKDEAIKLIRAVDSKVKSLKNGSVDEKEYMKRVWAYRNALKKAYDKSFKSNNSSIQTYELNFLWQSVNSFVGFHSMNELADWPRQEIYEMKSIDINGNIYGYEKDTRIFKSYEGGRKN